MQIAGRLHAGKDQIFERGCGCSCRFGHGLGVLGISVFERFGVSIALLMTSRLVCCKV
jgi:hypothetical protein